jgi:hypothetical protein
MRSLHKVLYEDVRCIHPRSYFSILHAPINTEFAGFDSRQVQQFFSSPERRGSAQLFSCRTDPGGSTVTGRNVKQINLRAFLVSFFTARGTFG